MIKLKGISLLLLIIAGSCNEKIDKQAIVYATIDEKYIVYEDEGNYCYLGTNIPANGEITIINADSLHVMEGFCKNGKLDGKTHWFHGNGTVSAQATIVDGIYQDTLKRWYETGILQEQAIFKNNAYHGIRTFWYPNGSLKAEYQYIHGKMDGLFKEWYLTGQLKKTGRYLKGELEGDFFEFHENGITKAKMKYQNGKINGIMTLWDSQGNETASFFYQFGKGGNKM